MILFPVINFIFVFKNFTESCIVNDDYSEICSFVYKTIKENHTRPKTKGVQVDSGSIIERVKNGMQLPQVLLICSLEDALQTADSMQARGFGVTKRTTYIRYRMERRDWYTLNYLIILFIAAIVCSIMAGKLIIYPKVESILFQQYDGMMFVVFTMFISLPIIMEGREWIWWRMQK